MEATQVEEGEKGQEEKVADTAENEGGVGDVEGIETRGPNQNSGY